MSDLDKEELDRVVKTAKRVLIAIGVIVFCCFIVFCAKKFV